MPEGLGDMDQMMKEFQNMMKNADSNPEFKNAMDQVMTELTNSEAMLEPMENMLKQYPIYIEANKETLTAEDVEKFKK
jgi:hypothetical protein